MVDFLCLSNQPRNANTDASAGFCAKFSKVGEKLHGGTQEQRFSFAPRRNAAFGMLLAAWKTSSAKSRKKCANSASCCLSFGAPTP